MILIKNLNGMKLLAKVLTAL